MIVLDKKAKERGTFVVDITFKGLDGGPLTPNSGLTWTLTDSHSNVVNSREAVVIAPSSTITIVLSGDDLALGGLLYGKSRKILIKGTFDSTLGNGLPLTEEALFFIEDFTALV